jgi:hypothetical protein
MTTKQNTAVLLSDLHRLVDDEQQTAHYQLMETWARPLSEKLRQGRTQGLFVLSAARNPQRCGHIQTIRNPCRIPDDSIQHSRWPLFFVREVLVGYNARILVRLAKAP